MTRIKSILILAILVTATATSCSAKNDSSRNPADTVVEMADNDREVGEQKDTLETPQASGEVIKKGDNLRAVLTAASKVTYDYDADSGIWANIGNLSIVIDEDQLTPEGFDFIAAILSDIAPDIDFKPEYVKPDATVQRIEVQ